MKWMLLIAATVGSIGSSAWAWDDEDEGKTLSYNEIVNELEMETKSLPKPKAVEDTSDIKTYFGVAYSMSRVESSLASSTISGSQFTLGMDVTSKMSIEGSYRNFPGQEVSSRQSVTLQEIEGRVLYRPRLNDNWHARLGAGLANRNVSFTTASSSSYIIRWSLGFERTLSPWLRLLPEISVRSSLLGANDTDKQGLDAGLGFQLIF